MTKKSTNSLESLAEEIRALGNNLRWNLCIQLRDTATLVDKYMVSQTKKYGQKQRPMEILYALTIHSGIMRPSDISRILFQSRQMITHIIDNLEKDRLVKREAPGKDRRTRMITITKKGLNLVRESLPAFLEITNSAMPQFEKEELETHIAFLRKVRKHLYNELPK